MTLIEDIIGFLVSGGSIMLPLSATAFALWYVIGARWSLLQQGRMPAPRSLIMSMSAGNLSGSAGRHPIALATAEAFEGINAGTPRDSWPYIIDEAFSTVESTARRYRKSLMTLVVIAPLLGLLGTVVGMIEAFEAITNASSQDTSSGIAGGIAKALFATQFGLIIAIPGMIFGSFLNRKEKKIISQSKQVKSLIATHIYEDGDSNPADRHDRPATLEGT